MRKPIPKSVRKRVYAKYDGHCAYCGCKIPEKGFNVDHLYCLRNYEYTEDFTGIDVHDIKNFMRPVAHAIVIRQPWIWKNSGNSSRRYRTGWQGMYAHIILQSDMAWYRRTENLSNSILRKWRKQ